MVKIFSDPTFWVAIATFSFFALAFKPMKNAFFNGVDSKISNIKKAIEDAERLKKEAEDILKEAQAKLSQSEIEANNIISFAKSQAEDIINRTKVKLEKDIQNRKNIVISKIKSLEETSLDEIKKNVSALTIMTAHTVIEENLSDNDSINLIDDSTQKLTKVTLH
ncbi:MAG: hypothetical protein SFT90_02665 [Rickettsiales bacterium]|nr:hypothetical protein [Rickettsiales bacterium]